MKPSRAWPVLTGLVSLLAGALWLEVSSQDRALAAEVIHIRGNRDASSLGDGVSWYSEATVSDAHARARQLALRGDFGGALKLLAQVRAEHAADGALWAESGHWARRAERYDVALELLSEADKRMPQNATVMLDRALALEASGRVPEALGSFQRAMEKRPLHTPTRLYYANLLAERGEPERAEVVLTPATKQGSNEERARALVHLAKVEVQLGKAGRARTLLGEAIERAPALESTWLGAARALLDSKDGTDHESATKYALQGIALAPEVPPARSLLGRIYERRGQLGAALDAYRQCLHLDPHYDYARRRALRIALETEDYADARRHSDALLAQLPDDKESHFLAGLVESRAGDAEAARAHYQKAIDVAHGEYPEALYNLGLLESRADNVVAAAAAYRQAIEIRPDYASAWNNLGVLLSREKKDEEAMAAFERALEISPSFASAWRNLARHQGDMGRHPEAVHAFQNALLHDASDRSTRLSLGVELRKAGNTAAAVKLYQELLRDQPRYVLAWYNLGIALAANGDAAGATRAYRQALELDPQHRRSLKNLGLLLARQGADEEALRLLAEASEIEPKDSESRLALASLYARKGEQAACAREARRVVIADPDLKDATTVLEQCSRN